MVIEMVNVWIDKTKQKIDNLPAGDQRALLIMCCAIALAVIYLSLSWSSSYQKSALTYYEKTLEDSRWMDANHNKLIELASVKKKKLEKNSEDEGASLINLVTTYAKPFGIAFKRFQPQDESGLRLWIEGAEFDMLMRWLAALNQQNIQLNQLEITRQERQPGLAEARLLVSTNQ